MFVLHDLLVMLFHYRTDSGLKIKAQERKEFVIERHRDVHVFDSDLYMVDGRFQGCYLRDVRTSDPSDGRRDHSRAKAGHYVRLKPDTHVLGTRHPNSERFTVKSRQSRRFLQAWRLISWSALPCLNSDSRSARC